MTDDLIARVEELEKRFSQITERIESRLPKDRVCIICFSGDWDRLFAALTIAHGALAAQQEVHLFFTFWGVSALMASGEDVCEPSEDLTSRMFKRILPRGIRFTPLSRMNWFGLGRSLMRRLMRRHNVEDVDVLLREVRELGAKIYLCETSALLLGVKKEQLMNPDQIERCGVSTFMNYALKSRLVLFV